MKLEGLAGILKVMDLSYRKAEKKTGITAASLHRLAHGGEARRSTAEQIATGLGVTVGELEAGIAERQRMIAEKLEGYLRDFEMNSERDYDRWLWLSSRAELMKERAENAALRERFAYVATVAFNRAAELVVPEEELRSLELPWRTAARM